MNGKGEVETEVNKGIEVKMLGKKHQTVNRASTDEIDSNVSKPLDIFINLHIYGLQTSTKCG